MNNRESEIEFQNNRINEIFDENDIDKSGKLSKDTFFKVFKSLMKCLGEGDNNEKEIEKIAEEAIAMFDINKNGLIERNEFLSLMRFLIDEKGLSIDDTY